MKLYAEVTNTSQITGITLNEAHTAPSANLVVTAKNTTLDLGDAITASFGYEGDAPQMFSGYVKMIEHNVPDNSYIITAYDELIKATDYFIASSSQENPYTDMNVSAEDLVEDVLQMASITSYDGGTTYFTFGITHEIEINLISAYNICKTVADLLAWHLWADYNGTVHFQDRKPYVMDGESGTKTITSFLQIGHRISDRDLRNRIVVYGYGSIHAVAEAESPYLPAGFRKSVVVASPWIDYQDIAENAAEYNLEKLNRLTEELSIIVVGDTDIHARDILTVIDSYTETSGDWYAFTVTHNWGEAGYTTNIELRK